MAINNRNSIMTWCRHLLLFIGLHKKVSLGFIWENPRVEKHDAVEVTVDGSRDELRLTCILTPPLPLTKENFRSRDSIVKWMKIGKTHGNQLRRTFWSDNQDITAISLSKLKLQDLGTYGCSYQSLLKTINITGKRNSYIIQFSCSQSTRLRLFHRFGFNLDADLQAALSLAVIFQVSLSIFLYFIFLFATSLNLSLGLPCFLFPSHSCEYSSCL